MPAGGALTAGAIAAPLIGGLIGASSARRGREQAAAAAAAALAQFNDLGVPPDLSREIILKQFQNEGTLTPELEQEITLQASQMGQLKEDPALRGAQMEALNTLGQVSRGGLRAEDRASFNELRAKTQQDSEAKRQQILQQMQAQGMGSSGANLMAQLQSAQAAENTQSAGADTLAAEASKRALEAISQRASLAGSVRGQDLTAEEAKAKAIDDRNNFLYQNSVARQRANVGTQNSAQQANLANKQRLSELNSAQANAELLRQNQAKRDYWSDKMGLATAKANALNNQGTVQQQGAQAQANMYSGMGAAVGQGLGAAAANYKPAADTGSNFTPAMDNNAPKYDANGNRIS